jgi:hypothetical protein
VELSVTKVLGALVALQLSVAAAALPSLGNGSTAGQRHGAGQGQGQGGTAMPTTSAPTAGPDSAGGPNDAAAAASGSGAAGTTPANASGPGAAQNGNGNGNGTGTGTTGNGNGTGTNGGSTNNNPGGSGTNGGTGANAGFDCPAASTQTVPADSPLGTPGAYVVDVSGGTRRMADQAYDTGYRPHAAEALFTIRLASGASGLCLAPAAGGPARPVKAVTNLWNPALAPDGRSIAYAQLTDTDGNSEVHVMSIDGSADRVIYAAGSNTTVTWRSDGAALAACHNDQLLVTPTGTSATAPAPTKLPAACPDGQGLAFSPTGDRLATVSNDNLDIVDMRTGAVTRAVTKSHLNYEVPPSWSPDGKSLTIAFTGQDASGVLIAAASGSGAKVVRNGVVQGPNWAPAGNRIVFSTVAEGVTQMVVLDPNTGTSSVVARVARPLRPWLLAAAWSSDGKSFAFSIIGGTGPGAG